MGRRTLVAVVLFGSMTVHSCAILPSFWRSKPVRRVAPPPEVTETAIHLVATGTSPLGAEGAREAAEQGLQSLMADSLVQESRMSRSRLHTGEELGVGALARAVAVGAVSLRWSGLRRGVTILAVATPSERSDTSWSCTLRLRLDRAARRRLLEDVTAQTESRFAGLASLVDSTVLLVASAPFDRAVRGLSQLYVRGSSEWSMTEVDMTPLVARQLDLLRRRIRIQFGNVRPEGCLYDVSVRTVDHQGHPMPAVPLSARVRPGAGRMTEPTLPSNVRGEAIFSVEPSVSDSLTLSVEVPAGGLADLVSPSPVTSSALVTALRGHPGRARATTVLDLREEGQVEWDARLIPRWSERRTLFGSALELLEITGTAVIRTRSPYPRRAAVRCTRVSIGSDEWVPEGRGLLLASFRLSEEGSQFRPLATRQLLERVSELMRKSKRNARSPVTIRLALDLDAACSRSPIRLEQSRVLRHHTHEDP